MPADDLLTAELLHTQTVVVLVGPTASGKTRTSIQLAHALGGPAKTVIVSADSRLVYQGLDIGTAKPTLEERQGILHALIDVARPTETFTAGDYAQQASQALEAAWESGKVPILTGGTGFYFQSLLQPNLLPTITPSPGIRAQLDHTRRLPGGAQRLYDQLTQLDPQRAAALHPHDVPRVVRALEICLSTGQPTPKVDPMAHHHYTHRCLWLGLRVEDRPWHHQVIEQRVDAMLAQGWLEEVEALKQTWGEGAHALQVTHGYPELLAVLAGKRTRDNAREDIALQVRQYAKRQRVWFQRNPNIHWVAAQDKPEAILTACLAYLSNPNSSPDGHRN
jgi:tRNA dimethylallyltransferase